jgi:hypothetical protein
VFDAVYARIPVVLYQSRAAERVGTQKFDLSTLEFRERHRIGRVCTDVTDLDAAINDVVTEPEFFLEKVGGLRDDLFVDVVATDAVTQATAKVQDLLGGRIPRLSKPQTIVRETIQRLLSVEREMQTLRKARQSFWRRRFADLGALFSALNGA